MEKKQGEVKVFAYVNKIQIGNAISVKIIAEDPCPLKTQVEMENKLNTRINEPQILRINLFDKFGNMAFESQSMIVFLKEGSKERKLIVPDNESSFVCRFTPTHDKIDICLYHDKWKSPVHYQFTFLPERKFKIFFENKKNLMKNLIKKLFEFTTIFPTQIITEDSIEKSEVILNIGDDDQDLLEKSKNFEKNCSIPVFILRTKKKDDVNRIFQVDIGTVFTLQVDSSNMIENSEENRLQMIKLSQKLYSLNEND